MKYYQGMFTEQKTGMVYLFEKNGRAYLDQQMWRFQDWWQFVQWATLE